MKLRLKLNEADVSRGNRLLYVKQIYPKLENWLKSINLGFKSSNDEGFYILPKFKHLVNIRFLYKDDEIICYVSNVCQSKDSGIEVFKKPVSECFVGEGDNRELNSDFTALLTSTAAECNKLILKGGKIPEITKNEALLEYANPFAAIKNAVKNKLDMRAAVKQAEAEKKAQAENEAANIKACLEKISTTLKDLLAKSNRGTLTVQAEVASNSADISVLGSYVIGITFASDVDDANKLVIYSVRTPDDSAITYEDHDITLEQLCNAINIKFNAGKNRGAVAAIFKNDADNTANGDGDSEAKGEINSSDYMMDEIENALPADSEMKLDQLRALLESKIELTEAAAMIKYSADDIGKKYYQVYQQIKANKEAVIALTKRFIHKALNVDTSVVDKLSSSDLFPIFVEQLYRCKDLTINTSNALLVYLMSMHIKLFKEFARQITQAASKTKGDTLTKLKADLDAFNTDGTVDINNADLMFTNKLPIVFFKPANQVPADELSEIIRYWYTIKDENLLAADAEVKKSEIADKFLVDAANLDNAAMKKVIFLDDSNKFRSAADILAGLNIVIPNKTKKDAEKPDTAASVNNKDELIAAADSGDMTNFVSKLNGLSDEDKTNLLKAFAALLKK